MKSFSPGKSDFLNLVRWIAAVAVVLGHVDMYLAQFAGAGSQGWSSFGYAGLHSHAAVMLFFVLSGYVVAYATNKKLESEDYGFRAYFLDRWSRIYSVLLLAVAFTVIIDFLGRQVSAAYYDPEFLPQSGFAVRLAVNVFALQGIQGHRIQLGSNPALWSIGYEFIFYLLYGLVFFRTKLFSRTWMAPALLCVALVVVGWKMAFYFGIWLLGVLAYRLSQASGLRTISCSRWLLLLILAGANHYLVFANVFGLPEVLQDMLFGAVVAVLLVFDASHGCKASDRLAPANAYMADFSYSLYAFHMPIIFFFCSVFFAQYFRDAPQFVTGLILALGCLLAARIFFAIGEARRFGYRRAADYILRKVRL